jgi:hypothetical protein
VVACRIHRFFHSNADCVNGNNIALKNLTNLTPRDA